MKISVITPAYNEEKYLRETLDSILNQTMPASDYEVIVVNNGSTDGTEGILREYAQRFPNLRYLSQENAGPGGGRNTGIDLAQGDYFFFLDGDDLALPDSLQSMYDRITAGKADLLIGGYEIYDGTNRRKMVKIRNMIRKESIDPFDPDLLWTFSLFNKLFRASVIRENRIRFQKLIYSEDGIFVMEFLEHCNKITGLDQTVSLYRKMEGSGQTVSLSRKMAGSGQTASLSRKTAGAQGSITSSISEEKLDAFLECHRQIREILKRRLTRRFSTGVKEFSAGKSCASEHSSAIDQKAAAAEKFEKDPIALRCLRELDYKELHTLIDQFYLHYWSIEPDLREKLCAVIRDKYAHLDKNGRIRTIQQWYDLDLGQIGHEKERIEKKPLMAAALYIDSSGGCSEYSLATGRFLKTLRCLVCQDMVCLKILLPSGAKKLVEDVGLLRENIYFLDADGLHAGSLHADVPNTGGPGIDGLEAFQKAASAEASEYVVFCKAGSTFPVSTLRTMYRKLTLSRAGKIACYPPKACQYRFEKAGHVADKVRRTAEKWLYLHNLIHE